MLNFTDFSGLLNQRFFKNFFPIPASNQLKIGSFPPDFSLINVATNQPIRLSDYRGKQSVIIAFTRIFTEKQYCPFCFPHIKALNENYDRFLEKGIEILLITSTDDRQSQTVVRDLALQMPLLSDPACHTFQTYRTGQALGAPLPAQFVLNQQGTLRYKHLFSFLDHNANIEKLLSVTEP
ncbi:MAG: redoxin domain-containing protein [Scytolyngbya sp. HA4215-MV1]|jgi:peroxiredoxin|nr:redoxin domain-containing protein [Scytolyngbya sp. HA4215-MV1]